MGFQKSKINLLIVDDHPESLLALEATLSSPNYNIVKASSGEEALRALLKMDFALILLDVRMPNANGFEIARLIRQRQRNRHVPIIFVSGHYKDTESITEGYMAGAVDYLLKPVDPDIIRAKCAFFIDLHLKNESLKQAGKHYEGLVDLVKVIVWRAESQNIQFTYISKDAERILGYAAEEWTGSEDFWKEHIHPADRNGVVSAFLRASQQKTPEEVEYRMIASDGRVVWLQNMFRLSSAEGGPNELAGIMVDITDRKVAEEMIRKSNEELETRIAERTAELRKMLQEKEVLIKEIHHRVKNNLQIISSLLKLQKRYSANPDGWDALTESQNRVLSMALIHEKLYETTDFTEINFAAYIQDLARHLFASYGIVPGKINFNVKSDILLSMDTAVPCGLIVNELISNALKHAFPNSADGEITVSLIKEGQQLHLIVRDNGAGISKQFDMNAIRSLGLKLVTTLATQLNGRFEMKGDAGTEMKIIFPVPKQEKALGLAGRTQ